jgi:transposase
MDNRDSHKSKYVRAAIEAARAVPVYLPTYSPELNPIELWWADMKRTLRKLAIDVESDLRCAARQQREQLSNREDRKTNAGTHSERLSSTDLRGS